MAKLRVGVIGLGMGSWHIRGYQTHPSASVVAIADMDPKRLAWAGDKYKVPGRYVNAQEMLDREGLDVVSVATPNRFHMPLTIAALRAGCHVLCEKPMAMNAGEASLMLAAARKAKKRIMINFSYRFTGAAKSLKRAVEGGLLGKAYFARTIWHRSRGMPGFGGWFGQKALAGGGPLIDLGVHRLDLALWLMGYPEPAWVLAGSYDPIASRIAKKAKKKFDVEDLATAMIRFKNGATLAVEASWAVNRPEGERMETRIYGTEGGLVHRNIGGTYNFEAEGYVERGGKVVKTTLPKAPAEPSSAMKHFIECLSKNKKNIATGEEGRTVMTLLDAIYKSAKLGAPVRL